jgi:tetratricopeptide (TPR) repeat protein
VTTPAQRSALAALDAARPTFARLESEQNSEDRAADLIEGWSAVETALRSLMGGSALTGRALIHEVRSRQVITFGQGNALAQFEAARSRAERPGYEPTQTDINAALDAYVKLEAGLRAASAASGGRDEAALRGTAEPLPAGAGARPAAAPLPLDGSVPTPRGPRPDWQKWVIGGVAALAVVVLGGWLFVRNQESAMERAVAFYRAGQREQAQAAFERAAREEPKNALPHVYLSRMARDVGNLTLARDEANRAIQADSKNPLALREMAAYLLTSGNYELARRFYVRAVEADTTDKTAQGYLGCVLIRLGRVDEGRRWLTRAGQGTWSSCGTMAPAGPMPPTGGLPGQQPFPQSAPPPVP